MRSEARRETANAILSHTDLADVSCQTISYARRLAVKKKLPISASPAARLGVTSSLLIYKQSTLLDYFGIVEVDDSERAALEDCRWRWPKLG